MLSSRQNDIARHDQRKAIPAKSMTFLKSSMSIGIPLHEVSSRRCASSKSSSSSKTIINPEEEENLTNQRPQHLLSESASPWKVPSTIKHQCQQSKKVIQLCWSQRTCRYTCYGIIGLFLLLLIFTPLFIKYALPVIITNGFANNGFGISDPVVISLFQLDALSNGPGSYAERDSSSISDIVGSANISANVSQPGYNSIIPFGIPVTISPMTWTISLAVETINTELAYQRVEATFFPMMTIIIPSESHLIDGTLSLNTQDAGVQFLNPAAFKALNISLNIDGLAPSQFPLGARFIRGFMQCLMSAVSGDVPKILIESRVDLKVGALQLNGIHLRRVIDVGKILVQNAMPFPMVGSKSQMISSDPDDMFQFGNLVPILTDGAGNVEIAFPKSRYPVNPISVSFTSLRMRFNVSNVPVYMVAAPVIHEVQGSQNISFSVKTTPIGTAGVTLVSSFLFQDQSRLRLGIDSVDVRDAIGGKIQWLSDMCSGIWVQIPFSVFGKPLKS